MEPPKDKATKVCSIDPGNMIKMAAMPIYGLKKITLFRTDWPMPLRLVILEYYQVCSNDDSRLTFDLFTRRSTLVPYALVWEKAYMANYQETVEVYLFGIKVGIYSKLNVYMEIYMYQRSSFFDFCPRSLRFN